MAFEGNASGSQGFDPPGRYFVQRTAAASEPGPEPIPSLLPGDSDNDSAPDSGHPASSDPPAAAAGSGSVAAAYTPAQVPNPGPCPGWATLGDSSTGPQMAAQLSRLRPHTRDRIVQLCTSMAPMPKAPKSTFPPVHPASSVPKADGPRGSNDGLGILRQLFWIRRSPQPWLRLRRSVLPGLLWFTRRRALYSARRRVASTNAAVRCTGAGTAITFAESVIVFIADCHPLSVARAVKKECLCIVCSRLFAL